MVELMPLTAQDAGLISHIHAACWRTAYQDLIDPDYLSRLPEDYWVAPVQSYLATGVSALLLRVDGAPAGCVCYGRGRDEAREGWGEIVSLYLLPEAIGQGYGRLLLDRALEELRREGYDRVYLWMIDGCLAEHFYLRQGFCRTGEKVDYRIGRKAVRDVRLVLESTQK